ncbi:MAG: LacI family transcriptional regulator [Propionibacteriales bacterium]|nr:LacI family transcriptional regulator [Propionibacteriales bacterium]
MIRPPTVKTVAEEAGVSTATVSNVLAGRTGRVSEATSVRVRAVAERLGYHPSPTAQAVRTGRTRLVLLSMTMLIDPWVQDVADAVSRRIRPDGLHALVLPDGDWSRVLDQQAADLAFIDHVRPAEVPRLDALARRGVPMVVFHEDLEARGYDVISSPAVAGCVLAMRHLLASHTRIACLTAGKGGDRSPRYRAYEETMREAGLSIPDGYVAEFALGPGSATTAAYALLTQPEPPTAIFATTDFAAMAAIRAAQRLHLSVPEDVAVIGAGNTLQAAEMAPSVSTVGPADLFTGLSDLIRARALGEDTSPHRVHHHPWQLFARESTVGTGNSPT